MSRSKIFIVVMLLPIPRITLPKKRLLSTLKSSSAINLVKLVLDMHPSLIATPPTLHVIWPNLLKRLAVKLENLSEPPLNLLSLVMLVS